MAVGEDGSRICDVSGCSKEAERSVSGKKLNDSSLVLDNGNARSVHLCKDHYRTFRKETKKERKLESLSY